jgi:hypothetical protein
LLSGLLHDFPSVAVVVQRRLLHRPDDIRGHRRQELDPVSDRQLPRSARRWLLRRHPVSTALSWEGRQINRAIKAKLRRIRPRCNVR